MIRFSTLAILGGCALALSACDVEQTQEGEMPEVQGMPTIEGGQLPEYDVDVPEVEVTTEERTIEVPEVNVKEADAGAE